MNAYKILEQVKTGAMSVEEAGQLLDMGNYEELGYAKIGYQSKGENWFCRGSVL